MLRMLKNILPLRHCRWKPAVPVLLVIALTMAGYIAFAEELSDKKPAYPLWDGQESVEQYAKKVNLPATKTLELGNGVKLELVLIPAGKFVMGTPDPTSSTETVALGQGILFFSAACVLGLLIVVVFHAIRNAYSETFNSRFGDEVLKREVFDSLMEAKVLVEKYRREYNEERPHSALNYTTPAEFAAQCSVNLKLGSSRARGETRFGKTLITTGT